MTDIDDDDAAGAAKLTKAESGRDLAVFLGRFAGHVVHVVASQRRQAGVVQLGLDGRQLGALHGRMVEAVQRRVFGPDRWRTALTDVRWAARRPACSHIQR